MVDMTSESSKYFTSLGQLKNHLHKPMNKYVGSRFSRTSLALLTKIQGHTVTHLERTQIFNQAEKRKHAMYAKRSIIELYCRIGVERVRNELILTAHTRCAVLPRSNGMRFCFRCRGAPYETCFSAHVMSMFLVQAPPPQI